MSASIERFRNTPWALHSILEAPAEFARAHDVNHARVTVPPPSSYHLNSRIVVAPLPRLPAARLIPSVPCQSLRSLHCQVSKIHCGLPPLLFRLYRPDVIRSLRRGDSCKGGTEGDTLIVKSLRLKISPSSRFSWEPNRGHFGASIYRSPVRGAKCPANS